MRKMVLTNGTGWFDADAAKKFLPETDFTGSGREVCLATREPGCWETLYLTAGGSLVLHRYYEDHHPEVEYVYEIDKDDALRWLLLNGYQEQLKKLELEPEENALEI